ncbi:MAG: exosome complex RNA-binding protein Rrp4 [archaeon]
MESETIDRNAAAGSGNRQGRRIVIPGETVARGLDNLPGDGTYRINDEIRSCVLGIAEHKGRVVKIIPLGGRYIPNPMDVVIGIVDGVRFSNWAIEINSPYKATMPLAEASESYIDTRRNDMSDFFAIGDTILCKVSLVDNQMNTNVSVRGPGLQKLSGGHVFEIAPAKVPRVIGKGGSMVRTIKEATGCNIFVGQNGRIWLKGPSQEKEALAIRTIKKIEEEAHTTGLTERIRAGLGLPPEAPEEIGGAPTEFDDGTDTEREAA